MADSNMDGFRPTSATEFQQNFAKERPVLQASGDIARFKVDEARATITSFRESHPNASALFKQPDQEDDGVEASFGRNEFKELRQMLQEVVPVTAINYKEWMNANLTGRMARELAAHAGINPDKAAAAAVLQVLLPTLTGEQFNRSFLVAKQMFSGQSGLRADLLQLLIEPTLFSPRISRNQDESDESYNARRIQAVNQNIGDMPLEKAVVLMSTLLGKRGFDSRGVVKPSFDENGTVTGAMSTDDSVEDEVSQYTFGDLLSRIKQLEPKVVIDKNTDQFKNLEDSNMYDVWPSERVYAEDTPNAVRDALTALRNKFPTLNLSEIQKKVLEDEINTRDRVAVFDIGGVAIESPSFGPMIPTLARELNVSPRLIQGVLDPLYGAHHIDYTSPNQFLDAVTARLVSATGKPVTLSEVTKQNIFKVFKMSLQPVMDPTLEQGLAKLRKDHPKVPLVAFTNVPPVQAEVNTPIYEQFDDVVRSYAVHASKGNERDFMVLSAKYDLPMNAFIFLDDNLGNIERASSLGMHGIQVKQLGQMDQYIPEIEANIPAKMVSTDVNSE